MNKNTTKTVKELITDKQRLEKDILALLLTFEEEYGLQCIKGISFIRYHGSFASDLTNIGDVNVDCRVD